MSLGCLGLHSQKLLLIRAAARHLQNPQTSFKGRYENLTSRRRGKGLVCIVLSSNPIENIRIADKRRSLLRFVQDMESRDLLEDFHQSAPSSVMDAIRTAVTNLLGTLPPNFFNVTVSASQEDMAQIMYSALMMGYMYRNAQYRIDLDYNAQVEESNLSHIDFDAFQQLQKQETIPEVVPIYADGVQVSHVSGDVVRWRKDTESVERFDAQSYIRKCESEIASLRDQVSKLMYQRSTGNELLDYIKVQEPAALKELTQHISTPVIEAMNSFVERLIGTEERRVEARNPELATTFYVLIVVGYYLRQLEVKCDFESSYTVPALSDGWD